MANERKEVLRLTVPRRHVLAAAMCVSTEESRPILNHICFRPAKIYELPSQAGELLTIATDGHKLVELTGGKWAGEWPLKTTTSSKSKSARVRRAAAYDTAELLIRPECFIRKKAKKLLDTDITVRLFDDGEIQTIDATADYRFESEGRKHPGAYPFTDKVFKQYGGFAIARDTVNLDASYLEEMGKLGTIFSDKTTHPGGILLRRHRVGENDWHPVFTMEATSGGLNRTMRVLLMGTRDVR